MSTLIAIGAAIAVFTGIGAGIGIGHATGKAVRTLSLDVLLQRQQLSTVSSLVS